MKTIYHVTINKEELQLCERCAVKVAASHHKVLGTSEAPFRMIPDETVCQHCEIRRDRNRKPYREFRVTDPNPPAKIRPNLVLRVWPNGVLEVRESGRRVSCQSTVASLYQNCLWRDGMKAAREKAAARKAKRKAGRSS